MFNATKVPFFNYPGLFERHQEEFTKIFQDVMGRGAFIMQRELEEFEQALAHFIGVKHVFGVADGSNALNLALLASGVGRNDEVILPSHTFIATAAAVHFVGAKPVLVDCGVDHMIDPESIRKAITPKTAAIMPVQLNGRTAQMAAICKIAEEHKLKIVEDSAQALGSKFRGQSAGTFGSAGTFSFYPAKLLGAFGDGGAVVTNDDAVANKVYMLRDHGRDPEGIIRCWGFNSRLDNLQAAILQFKLGHFHQDIKRRRKIASMYEEMLSPIAQLRLPPAPTEGDHFDVYQNYEIEAEKRDELKNYLAEKGIGTLVQWGGKAIHQFEALDFQEKPSYTEKMFKRCLMIPMHPLLRDAEIEYIGSTIRSFYSGS